MMRSTLCNRRTLYVHVFVAETLERCLGPIRQPKRLQQILRVLSALRV